MTQPSRLPIRFAQDYKPGEIVIVGEYLVTRDEVLAFAQQWDPQPFHLDEEMAAQTIFGGIIASGWHVALIMMRMMLQSGFITPETSLGSPGHENLKWIKPVRPGDRLVGRVEITDTRMSRSRPDIGFVTTISTLRNQNDEEVYWLKSTSIIRSRPPAGPCEKTEPR